MIMIRAILSLVLLCLPLAAQSTLEIRITQGVEDAVPMAVVPFAWEGQTSAPPQELASIISSNLRNSGLFRPLDPLEMPQKPTIDSEVNYPQWRSAGSEVLVVGSLRQTGADAFSVRFQLLDVASERQLMGYNIPVNGRGNLRRTAHMISDMIYERLTGERGAFETEIAYVSVERNGPRTEYVLYVADSDGYDPRDILRSHEPILSPSWSPDGRSIAYVSFEKGRSEIYVQNIRTAERQSLASHQGINSAPAWSPDGRRLAVTLSRDGQPDIYVLTIADRSLQRITNSRSIDTEPVWMPDGRSIVFTSDRAGQPQLYEVPVSGGEPSRLSFEGRYNGSASVSPDGRYVAMVHSPGGRFQIGLLDRNNRQFRVLTNGRADESPSFSPNGRMIIYATQENGRGVLAAVSQDGRVRQSLVTTRGEVREPAWSPFLNQ